MILLPFLFLAAQPLPVSPPAVQERAEKPAEKRRRAFPHLSASGRHEAEGYLLVLRTGKTPEAREAARGALAGMGSAVVPVVLDYFRKIGPERAELLRKVLDQVLVEEDLDLAWKHLGRKAAPPARAYVARRFADSRRQDARDFLARMVEDKDPELRWQAARGLAWRGDAAAVPVLLELLPARWPKAREGVGADFAGIERGPLSGAVLSRLQRATAREDRLAAIRLFGLVGIREHAAVLKAPLEDSDRLVTLAAINACRAIFNGEPPLEKPSVFRDIELAREWREKL